ncbi:TOBE domain-containing protein [Streptomyces purpureus]|uniref:TOBE domain-containing protein n=1 Tax=Streptomyces purpureus TaxID=1951 RepID=UPI0037B8AED7
MDHRAGWPPRQPAHHRLELPDVLRPGTSLQHGQGIRGEPALTARPVLAQEEPRQVLDVPGAVAQGRHLHQGTAEPVELVVGADHGRLAGQDQLPGGGAVQVCQQVPQPFPQLVAQQVDVAQDEHIGRHGEQLSDVVQPALGGGRCIGQRRLRRLQPASGAVGPVQGLDQRPLSDTGLAQEVQRRPGDERRPAVGDRAQPAWGIPRDTTGVQVGVRPEYVKIVTDPGPNTFPGRLRGVTDHGAQRVLEVEVAGQLVRTKTPREEGVPAGEEVLVHLPRAKVLPYADGRLVLRSS